MTLKRRPAKLVQASDKAFERLQVAYKAAGSDPYGDADWNATPTATPEQIAELQSAQSDYDLAHAALCKAIEGKPRTLAQHHIARNLTREK